MTYNIEQFKGNLSKERGLAMSNLFLVELPSLSGKKRVDGGSINGYPADDFNLLCKAASLPGRQILTSDRTVGMNLTKNAYGYSVEDVTLSFYVTNTYKIKSYFEDWMGCAISNAAPYEVGYYDDYVEDIRIHQLRKGELFKGIDVDLGFDLKLPQVVKDNLPTIGGIDLGELSEGNLSIDIGSPENTVYTCSLFEAFPTSMVEIPLSNDQNGIVEFSVQMSYKNWRGEFPQQEKTISDTVEDTVSNVIDAVVDVVGGLFG